MECPYCRKPMKDGYLGAQTMIAWSEDAKESGDRWIDREKGDVLVSDARFPFSKTGKRAAAFCPECGVVIVRLSDTE